MFLSIPLIAIMMFIYAMKFVMAVMAVMTFNNWNKFLLGVMDRFVNVDRCMMLDFNGSWMNFGYFD